jgi:AraC family ethanolamine operon transcriptional activator
VASDALTISRSPDFDHFQGIEGVGEARSIPLDCKGFAACFAAVTLKSCEIHLQQTFPRILQMRYCIDGALVGFTMDDASSVILNGLEGRAPSILLARGRAVCEVVEPQANLIA